MTTDLFAPVEAPVRDWVRGLNLAGIANRVYVGVPNDATYPLIDCQLLDGGVLPGEAPVMHALFSFSVWGNDTSMSEAVRTAAFALVSELQSVRFADLGTHRMSGVEVVLGPRRQYDPDGTPRYVIDAAFTLVVAV